MESMALILRKRMSPLQSWTRKFLSPLSLDFSKEARMSRKPEDPVAKAKRPQTVLREIGAKRYLSPHSPE
jgi:hypothetical protein